MLAAFRITELDRPSDAEVAAAIRRWANLALSPADLVAHLARLSPLNNSVVGGCACWSCPPDYSAAAHTGQGAGSAVEHRKRDVVAILRPASSRGITKIHELWGANCHFIATVCQSSVSAGKLCLSFCSKKNDNGMGRTWGLRSSLPIPCNFDRHWVDLRINVARGCFWGELLRSHKLKR